MFLTTVSGGLVALGLVATASHVGTMFFAFGLVLLPTLAFVGVVTFERALQTGIEDHGYAARLGKLRAFYFDFAPEVTPYLAGVPPVERFAIERLQPGLRQSFRTVAGMVGVITSVLAGSTAALAAALASLPLAGAVASGVAVALAVLAALMRYQGAAWSRAMRAVLFEEQTPGDAT